MNKESRMSADLERIFRDSRLDPRLKRPVMESLREIASRQDRLADELRAAFENESRLATELERREFPIYTTLCDSSRIKTLNAYGFFEIPATRLAGSFAPVDRVFFLNTSYDDFAGFCERRFVGALPDGRPIEYELFPYYGFVEVERSAALLWRLYGFKFMKPFSPWARRAVGLRIYGEEEEDLDLRLPENDLADKLLIGKSLLWNIEIRPDERASENRRVAPREKTTRRHYYYSGTDGSLALWPLPAEVISGRAEPEEIDVIEVGENVVLASDRLFATHDCWKIAFHEDAQADTRIFGNIAGDRFRGSPASKAQFNRFLSGLSNDDYGCRLAEKGEDVVARYSKWHRSAPLDRLALAGHRGEAMDVEFFAKDGDPMFLSDYANWVLEELERAAPFFAWRGIRA